jgi:hypothetical protein
MSHPDTLRPIDLAMRGAEAGAEASLKFALKKRAQEA